MEVLGLRPQQSKNPSSWVAEALLGLCHGAGAGAGQMPGTLLLAPHFPGRVLGFRIRPVASTNRGFALQAMHPPESLVWRAGTKDFCAWVSPSASVTCPLLAGAAVVSSLGRVRPFHPQFCSLLHLTQQEVAQAQSGHPGSRNMGALG